MPISAAGDEPKIPISQAVGVADQNRDVLRHRGRRGERDVDPAGDQHHEEPAGEDAD